jgi:hypothetical protein
MSALMGFLGFGTGVTLKVAANNLGKRRTLASKMIYICLYVVL